jgi:hypothetical protein
MTRCGPVGSFLTVLLLCGAGISFASAQSLADVARHESERRKQVQSGRVYTNEDLAAADPAQTAPAPVSAGAQPQAETANPAGSQTDAPAPAAAAGSGDKPAPQPPSHRDEQYWRARAKALRGRLATLEVDAAAAERGLSEIDAGPQTPEAARERDVVAAAVARLQTNVRYLRDEVAQFEKFAELNKVPADWIR